MPNLEVFVGRDDSARRYLALLNLLWIHRGRILRILQKTACGLGRGGVLLRPLPEHLMNPKTGGAEPLPYEGNVNHRKEIPKFLFCNSPAPRAFRKIATFKYCLDIYMDLCTLKPSHKPQRLQFLQAGEQCSPLQRPQAVF